MTENLRLDVSVATLTTIPSGKVVDFITGKLMNDTPEEYVRQNIEMSLILEYRYEREQIEVEFSIKVGAARRRVDIAIFPPGVAHIQDNIAVIIETKKQGTNPSDKKEGVEQLKFYMYACPKCTDGMWTNGDDRTCQRKIFLPDSKPECIPSLDIPVPGTKGTEGPSRRVLRAATGDNLLFSFRRCHNYIAGNQGLQKPEAFWELLKLIFCKIEDERSSATVLEFYVSETERNSMDGQNKVKARLQKLFST